MARRLRELRQAANVTYSQMSQRAMYSTTALSMTAATGNATMPPWAKVRAFVTACGIKDPEEITRWRRDYDEATAAVQHAVAPRMPASDGPVPVSVVRTRTQFAAGLRALRQEAALSYQQLIDGSGGGLAKSTISDLLTGRIRPTETTVRTFLTACQQRIPVDIDEWIATLHRIYAGDQPASCPSANPPKPDPSAPAADSEAVMPAQPDRLDRRPPPLREARPAAAVAVRATNELRQLAAHGQLATHVSNASQAERRRLVAAAYEIVMPVVFTRATRRFEHSRGHYRCAMGIQHLEPDCTDRFYEDLEAVTNDLFRNASRPITNLEGWVSSRLTAALVDGHRRRRGQRGAIQRPRLPRWLTEELGDDQWRRQLALEILIWVGVPSTAGTRTWPLDTWAARREVITGEYTAETVMVARDVEQVLAIMRRRPAWYERYVERPLGRKRTPVLPKRLIDEARPLALTGRHEEEDSRLAELAATAIAAIADRIGQGEHPQAAVAEIIRLAFDSATGAEEMDRPPGESGHDTTSTLLTDPQVIHRITATVLDILNPGSGVATSARVTEPSWSRP
jgi:transcriptional regulator with XRE-family HTH domain